MKINTLFFELIRVAIGTQDSLSHTPTAEEWGELYNIAKKQSLVGIVFAGINHLRGDGDFGSSLGMPETLYLKWLGLTAKLARRNREVSEACVELVKQYAHDGISTCILKGQGNLVNYKTPSNSPCLGGGTDDTDLGMYRTPGDIDVWCWPQDPCGIEIAVSDLDGKGAHYETYHGKQAVIEYVKMLHRIAGTKPHEGVRYHHIDAPSIRLGSEQAPVEVEVHFRPLFLDSPLRNWRLQRWFKDNEQFGILSYSPCLGKESCADGKSFPPYFDKDQHKIQGTEGGFPIPSNSFNAVYQLAHIYRHLFDEGVGLRQLLDYYFVLRALHIEQETLSYSPLKGERPDHWQSMAQWAEGMGVAVKSNEEIMHTLSGFGMNKFASAVMYVLQTVFAMPDEYLICKPNEKEGKFLLDEIMQAGNFGKYDERIKRETPSIPRPLWLPCIGEKRARGKKVPRQLWHAWEKLKHNLRLVKHYPEEVIAEPFFRVYHWIWRRFELWRW